MLQTPSTEVCLLLAGLVRLRYSVLLTESLLEHVRCRISTMSNALCDNNADGLFMTAYVYATEYDTHFSYLVTRRPRM